MFFFKNCVIFSFLCFNLQILPVTFGKVTFSEEEIQVYNADLKIDKHIENNNANNYTLLNELNLRNSLNFENSESDKKFPWFLNIPLLPVIVATSNSIPEGACKRQLQLYLDHLKNGTLWATEMFDSSAKYPYGVFYGFTRHLGSFDQCNGIQTKVINNKDGKIEEIRSRYCLVDVKFKEKNEQSEFIEEYKLFFNPQVSAWEAIREKGDYRRYPRYFLQMALCFPAKCQTENIVAALKEPLDEFGIEYNLQIEASILPIYCSRETPEFSIYDKIFCFLFLLMLTMVIISTVIDINFDQNENLSLLLSFSARKNFNEIFKINYEHRGFNTIHFIRVLLAGLVVLGHRHLQYVYMGTISGSYFEWVLSEYIFGLLQNGPLVIDGFFALGGMLLSYSLLGYWSETKKFNFVFLVLKRLLRLLPLYMFITFAYATVLHRLGSGPFWELFMGLSRDTCSSYWWTNLFFINNYFGDNNKCVIQSWYLSVDFQCYIIGLFLIRTFHKIPRKIGYLFLCCTLIISTAIPFYYSYKHDLEAFYKSVATPRRVEDSDYFLNYYVKTHFRLAAYVIGIIFGAFIYDYKKFTWRLSETWSKIIFFITFVIILSTMWIATIFVNPNLKISAFYKALYSSLQRPIFAIGVCLVPLIFTIGDGMDFSYNILTAKWLQPFSRITYSIYLVHLVMHHYEFGTARTSPIFSFYNSIKYFIADIIYSACLALFVAIVIEFPLKNFINVLLKKRTNHLMQTPSSDDIQKKTK